MYVVGRKLRTDVGQFRGFLSRPSWPRLLLDKFGLWTMKIVIVLLAKVECGLMLVVGL